MSGDFPVNLARGITSQDCLVEGQLKPCVFQFTRDEETGLHVMSIQWLDDEKSEQVAKSMLRRDDGDPKFGLGFAVLATRVLDEIKYIECYQGLEYCRVPNYSPECYNPYHGHITVPIEMRSVRRQLASELALNSKLYRFDEPLPIE